MLENHQVTQEMQRPSRPGPNALTPATTRAGMGRVSPPTLNPRWGRGAPEGQSPRDRAPQDPQLTQDKWRCFACGQPGHLARDCLGRDETMPSTEASKPWPHPCHYLTTCWVHQTAAPPKLPVKVEGRDTEALLDSGSAITLVHPEYAGRSGG